MKRNNRTGVVLGLKATATKVSEEKIAKNPLVRAFALRFRQWRREQGRTLRQVATDLDMSIGTISEWENCKRYPYVDSLQSIVEYTGIPAWVFFHPGEGGSVNPVVATVKSKGGRRR